MTDTIIKGRLALRQISREVYHYHYPKEITASTLRELASKGAPIRNSSSASRSFTERASTLKQKSTRRT